MEDNITLGLAKTEDKAALVNMLNNSFRATRDSGFDFYSLLPKLFGPQYDPCPDSVVVKENGVIKASVGAYRSTVQVLDETLHIAGLGNVGVLPEARKNGYMQKCLAFAIGTMIKNHTDFSFLSGQRQRYGYFGFEQGGIRVNFNISRHNLLHYFARNLTSAYTLSEIKHNDEEMLDHVFELQNRRAVRYDRPREALYDILCSWEDRPFAILDGDKQFAGYAVLSDDQSGITELLLKNKSDLEAVIKGIFNALGCDSLWLRLPPFEPDYIRFFADFSETAGYNPCEMYNVFNFENTVRAFLKLEAYYKKLCDCETTLLIHGIAGDERLHILIKNNVPTVSVYDGECQTKLTHNEAMRTLFGFTPVEAADALPPEFLAALPLPIFTFSADCV